MLQNAMQCLQNGPHCSWKILVYTEDLEAHRKIKKLLQTPNEIMEVLKAVIYAKNNLQLLIDGSTQKTVRSFYTSL